MWNLHYCRMLLISTLLSSFSQPFPILNLRSVGKCLAFSRLWVSEDNRKSERRQAGSVASGIRKRKGEGGRACKHSFKYLIPPTWKKKPFLVKMSKVSQNLHMFGIELLALVSRGQADLHSVLRSAAIIHGCCVLSENLFEYRSLCVDVQKINYWQRIRPIWRIEPYILQEQSQQQRHIQHAKRKQACTQTATFKSCGVRMNITELQT